MLVCIALENTRCVESVCLNPVSVCWVGVKMTVSHHSKYNNQQKAFRSFARAEWTGQYYKR